MSNVFAETLQKLRTEKNMSQQQLATKMYVARSTIANWEVGRRVPDALLMSRLAQCLDVDVSVLLSGAGKSGSEPNIIIVDDEKIILSGGIPILEEVFPNAMITGFTDPADALKYAGECHISLAFMDIEMGNISGLDVCHDLLAIDPNINVIFLTAFPEYSIDAWSTGACGYSLKPISTENIREQLKHLRHPIEGLVPPLRNTPLKPRKFVIYRHFTMSSLP